MQVADENPKMKLISQYNSLTLEIIEDNLEIGFYLYIYNDKNICIADYLQDNEQATKEFAFEEYGVPISSWTIKP